MEDKKRQRAARFAKQSKGYGFVSKGEDLLQRSSKEREKFYQEILDNFTKYCESSPTVLRDLIQSGSQAEEMTQSQKPQETPKSPESPESQKSQKSQQTPRKPSLAYTIDSILISLRKLREALISLKPTDFTLKVFLFSIRISTPINHYQTYVPAINYLLENPQLLDQNLKRELLTLKILHLSHVNLQHTKAIELYYNSFKTELTLLSAILSWYRKDFYNWVQIYNSESDNAKLAIMRNGAETMVKNMIYTIEKSYFNIEKNYLMSLVPNGVELSDYVQWDLLEKNVVVRKRPTKG